MKTFGTLAMAKDGRSWVLDADPHVHLRAKRLFGKLKKSERGKLVLSATPEMSRELAWFLDRYPMEMQADHRKQLSSGASAHVDHMLRLNQLIDPNYAPPSFNLALPARDYQAREAAVLLEHGGLLIGDDVGLGKSVAAIAAMTDPRALPAIVACQAHLPRQWKGLIELFAPDLLVHVVKQSTPYELPRFFDRSVDVLVLSYHKLDGWSKVLSAYGRYIVFDECQELRHEDSARYRAAQEIAAAMPYRVGLSATPIHNYGGEVYNVLDILKPDCLGTRDEFFTEWCVGADRKKASLKDAKAFGAWAREQFLIVRHTRKQLKREIPAISIPHYIDVNKAALDKVKGEAERLAELILSVEGTVTGFDKLQASEQFSMLLRKATGVAKAPYAADFIRMLVESDEQVLVFAWHREVYAILNEKLKDLNPVMYTGSESISQKEASLAAFIDGRSMVMEMSLRSGAGVNGLEKVCSVAVFVELDYSPTPHEQGIGRLARDGQDETVLAYYLLSDTGSDPAVSEILGIKKEQHQGIKDPDEPFLEEVNVSGDHVRQLAANYLKQRGRKVAEATA